MHSRFSPTSVTRTKVASFAAAALLVLSACGGGGSSSSNTAPADADVVARAKDGIAWDQKSYSATATDGKVTIYGVNDSSIAHNLYVIDSAEKVMGTHIELPKRGADGTLVLDLAPGTYRIVCKVPGHSNMNSELKVG